MYNFITGPLLWVTFAIFFIGLTVRVVLYIRGLDWRLDRVAYRAYPGLGIKGAISSVVHWLIPFGSYGWRAKPLYTIVFFVFHIGLVVTPLFLVGHAIILKERWGLNWPTIPMWLGRRPDHRGYGHHDPYRHSAYRVARGSYSYHLL